jgi:Fur family transcriptional regulator, ferric uptake regulator
MKHLQPALHLQHPATIPGVERTGHDYADVMDQLRTRGLRMTPQRRAIVTEVMRTQGHISPSVIARKVQGEMPGVNASTVYRTLTLLEEVGVLSHSHLETGAEYHKTEEAEHVHLTCGRCGKDDPLSLGEAHALQDLIRRHHGFEADLTHFAITGHCAACSAAAG